MTMGMSRPFEVTSAKKDACWSAEFHQQPHARQSHNTIKRRGESVEDTHFQHRQITDTIKQQLIQTTLSSLFAGRAAFAARRLLRTRIRACRAAGAAGRGRSVCAASFPSTKGQCHP